MLSYTALQFSQHTALNCARSRLRAMAPCINYLVCGNDYLDPGGEDTCMTCGPWFKVSGFGFGKLDIVPTEDACPVCEEATDRIVRFPQCDHKVCPECFGEIMFWDECMTHMDPRPFGCPPCPNSCDNPRRGRQCYCCEYDAVQDAWEAADPISWGAWNDAESESMEMPIGGHYSTKQCPSCKSVYDRSKHGFVSGVTLGRWESGSCCRA